MLKGRPAEPPLQGHRSFRGFTGLLQAALYDTHDEWPAVISIFLDYICINRETQALRKGNA